MANAPQSLKEILYNLDPSDRVSFPIYQDESLSEGSEKYNLLWNTFSYKKLSLLFVRLFSVVKQEVAYIKIKQMLWKKLSSEGYGFEFADFLVNFELTSRRSDDNVDEQIRELLNESGCKEV
jgi:hypothetical protein